MNESKDAKNTASKFLFLNLFKTFRGLYFTRERNLYLRMYHERFPLFIKKRYSNLLERSYAFNVTDHSPILAVFKRLLVFLSILRQILNKHGLRTLWIQNWKNLGLAYFTIILYRASPMGLYSNIIPIVLMN